MILLTVFWAEAEDLYRMNLISQHAQVHGLAEDCRFLPQIVHSYPANSRLSILELSFAAIAGFVAILQILKHLVVLRLRPKITYCRVVKTNYAIYS